MDQKEIKLLLLVVLYNKSLYNSETLCSLLRLKAHLQNTSIIIWDNSPEPQLTNTDLQTLKELLPDVDYLLTPENLPLSSIYNRVIQSDRLNGYDALVLLDHDSTLGENFFEEAKTSLAQHPEINLFLPIVESNNAIVSPAYLFYFKGVRWQKKQTGSMSTRWKAAINSGMVIRTTYLQNQFKGYDEELKFYGTDTYFMNCYAAQNKEFFVLDTTIQHQLNYFEKEELNSKLRRFHEIRRSTAILNRRPVVISILTKAYLFVFAFLQAIKFRSFRFIYDHKR